MNFRYDHGKSSDTKKQKKKKEGKKRKGKTEPTVCFSCYLFLGVTALCYIFFSSPVHFASSQLFWDSRLPRRSAHLKAPKSEICAKGQAAPSHLCRCTRSSWLSISPLSLLSSEPSTTAISPDLLQERAGGVRGAQGGGGRGGEILEGGRKWRARRGALTFQTAHVLALTGLIGPPLIFIHVYFTYTPRDWDWQYF